MYVKLPIYKKKKETTCMYYEVFRFKLLSHYINSKKPHVCIMRCFPFKCCHITRITLTLGQMLHFPTLGLWKKGQTLCNEGIYVYLIIVVHSVSFLFKLVSYSISIMFGL
uniref:Putative ovule protein n=2 Tax=Solanum chacoense TaxID=4108 RepID=A0A0V0HJL2_SOLCH